MRGANLCERQERRHRGAARDLQNAAKTLSQPISRFFTRPNDAPALLPIAFPDQSQLRQEAIEDLKKKLSSKKTSLSEQNLARHRAVLQLMIVNTTKEGWRDKRGNFLLLPEGLVKGHIC